MDQMEWALWALGYLHDARISIHDEFNGAIGDLRGYQNAHGQRWFSACKNIITTLYHYSLEFVDEVKIPSSEFASPQAFEQRLAEFRAVLEDMDQELDRESAAYQETNKLSGPPFLVTVAQRLVSYLLSAVDFVQTKKPKTASATPELDDIRLVASLARRFHESVLSLATHPHGGSTFLVKDEWDSQYLFRAILAAYFPDVRDEEWNPSVAGTSARCEFFLKALRTMIELKYVRKAADGKKIKSELATDLLDYGANPLVDHVICLVYDPTHALKNPVSVQTDLSGPTKGLKTVQVVISPPRDA